jgi:predicted transcriptional regulator
MGDIQHHLSVLEKSGTIKSRRNRMYRAYYMVSIVGKRQEDILAVLKHETPRDIIIYLIENPGATQQEIAVHKGFTAPTISWHMAYLINIGLVTSSREGRFVKYFIEGDIHDITSSLRSYYPTIWNNLSIRLVELFLELAYAPRTDTVTNEGERISIDHEEREEDKTI